MVRGVDEADAILTLSSAL